jgi:hypothetical protein
MLNTLVTIIITILPTLSLAAGNWGIDYNYDHPYNTLETHESKTNLKPIYIPSYRFSILQDLSANFGVRINLQRDNYFYGLNNERTTEYNAKSLDKGFYYTVDDILFEVGQSDSDSPIWKEGKASGRASSKKYIRFGKNCFLKDKLDLIMKVSKSENGNFQTLELKVIDKSTISRPEVKVRIDKSSLEGSDTQSASLVFVVGF